MTNFNQISKKYYRKAKHEMPLCYAEKKLYLAELSETLHAIETEHPYHEEGTRRHHSVSYTHLTLPTKLEV